MRCNKSYSVINSHKAMLLATLPFFGNEWCKKGESCVLIVRFMRGVFCNAPPKPRYRFTWDVTVVLRYLSSLFPLRKLTLKLLTLKTIALIALASAPRAQTLSSMRLDHMVVGDKCITFGFPNLLKTSRVGHTYTLKIVHFDNERLCAMHTLLHYIRVTKQLRQSEHVFISYVTHKVVSTSTLARWLKLVLYSSGIQVDEFKAHSFRSAAVSAAYKKGCSLKCILDTADWSSDKTFRRFYLRESVDSDITFSNAVFA